MGGVPVVGPLFKPVTNAIGGLIGRPKVPSAPPAPNAPTVADAGQDNANLAPSAASLISTSTQGLRRRANTQRTSLIGGGS